MRNARPMGPSTETVHLGFSELRQPVVGGGHRNYVLARGDQLAFAAEVVRFGFGPDDFALDVERLLGNRAGAAGTATFAVQVKNIRNGHTVQYLGGPGRAWVAEFLVDLMSGAFGEP